MCTSSSVVLDCHTSITLMPDALDRARRYRPSGATTSTAFVDTRRNAATVRSRRYGVRTESFARTTAYTRAPTHLSDRQKAPRGTPVPARLVSGTSSFLYSGAA